MTQAAAMARLSSCRGLVYWGALPSSLVHSLPGQEEARPAPAALDVYAERRTVLRDSAVQLLALAVKDAWADCQAALPGSAGQLALAVGGAWAY